MSFRETYGRAVQNLAAVGYNEAAIGERPAAQLKEYGPHGARKTHIAVAGDPALAKLIVYEALPTDVSLGDPSELVNLQDCQAAAGPEVCLVAVDTSGVECLPYRYINEFRIALRMERPATDQKTGFFGRGLGASVALVTLNDFYVSQEQDDSDSDSHPVVPDVLGLINPSDMKKSNLQAARGIAAARKAGLQYTEPGLTSLLTYPLDDLRYMMEDNTLPPTLLGFKDTNLRYMCQRLTQRRYGADTLQIVRLGRKHQLDSPAVKGAFLLHMLQETERAVQTDDRIEPEDGESGSYES